jgi:hypothetical protein
VAEGNRSNGPVETGEDSEAGKFVDVPDRCEGVGGADSEVLAGVVEVNADLERNEESGGGQDTQYPAELTHVAGCALRTC